jgi:hypothetical protein
MKASMASVADHFITSNFGVAAIPSSWFRTISRTLAASASRRTHRSEAPSEFVALRGHRPPPNDQGTALRTAARGR